MRYLCSVIALGLGVCASTDEAAAKDACQQYVGKVVDLQSFADAVKSIHLVEPKGEFETTAEYEARKAASKSVDLLFIEKTPEQGDYLNYSADFQKFEVHSYLFDNSIFSQVTPLGLPILI